MQAFRGLDSLRQLSLSHNELSIISPRTFGAGYGLEKLERLDLSYNQIDTIGTGTFSGLSRLRELRLDHNALRWIEPSGLSTGPAMTALPSLEFETNIPVSDTRLTWLYLGYNDLDRLTAETLSGLIHVKFLDASGNRIFYIGADAFRRNTPRLSTLLLRDNRLTELSVGTFDSSRHLKHINVAENRLTGLEPGVLQGLVRLEDLALDGNEISSLPASEAFKNTPRLMSLSARKNVLRKIDLGLVEYARRLRHLDLSQVCIEPILQRNVSASFAVFSAQ